MAGTLSNNQLLIRELVKQEYPNSAYKDEADFFGFFSTSQILKEYDLSDQEVESGLVGGGNDGGCDAVYMFFNGTLVCEDMIDNIVASKEAKLEMMIVQSKNTLSFGEDAILKWKSTVDNLL